MAKLWSWFDPLLVKMREEARKEYWQFCQLVAEKKMKLSSKKLPLPVTPDLEVLEKELNTLLNGVYIAAGFEYETTNKHIKFVTGAVALGQGIFTHDLEEFPANFSYDNVKMLMKMVVEARR